MQLYAKLNVCTNALYLYATKNKTAYELKQRKFSTLSDNMRFDTNPKLYVCIRYTQMQKSTNFTNFIYEYTTPINLL